MIHLETKFIADAEGNGNRRAAHEFHTSEIFIIGGMVEIPYFRAKE